MKSAGFKYSSLVIGLLAALIIIFSQSFSVSKTDTSKQDQIETSQSEESQESHFSSFSISTTSFPSLSQFGLFQEAFCLYEIFLNPDYPHEIPDASALPLDKFFSITLRVIISPNAPPL